MKSTFYTKNQLVFYNLFHPNFAISRLCVLFWARDYCIVESVVPIWNPNKIRQVCGERGKLTLALSWLMIFNLRESIVPSFISDCSTSSGVIIDEELMNPVLDSAVSVFSSIPVFFSLQIATKMLSISNLRTEC